MIYDASEETEESRAQSTVLSLLKMFSIFIHDFAFEVIFISFYSLFLGCFSDRLCTIQCIFRKPKECKERHKILMDLNTGDGADSAEDSGSSQPYPSTIPGIPKARVFHFSSCSFLKVQIG